MEQLSVRTVPPGFVGGRLDKSLFKDVTLAMVTVDPDNVWGEYVKRDPYQWWFDVKNAFVGMGQPLSPGAGKAAASLKKVELICYVLAVRGACTRDELLEHVAWLEGKPWVPTSNHEYFQSKVWFVQDGKRGRTNLYKLSSKGKVVGERVRRELGDAAAKR